MATKTTSSRTNDKRVVIIGAGISGLCAARLLTEQGINVVVLEARDRVGGRTYTVRDDAYTYTDLGGAYVGPTQRRVARLARQLGLEFYKVHTKGKTILNTKERRMTYHGYIPPLYNPIHVLDTNNIIQTLNRYASQVPCDAPWKAPRAAEWDSITFRQFLDQHCWTSFAKQGAEIMLKSVLCSEAHEVSLLFWLWYIAGGNGIQRLTSVKNGAQERKFVGGAMQLSEKMADELGNKVVMSHPVIRLEQGSDGAKVHTANGQVFEADYVISSMPQVLLNRVTFDPSLPPMRQQLIQRIPMGCIFKTMTFYDQAFWRDKGFRGEMASTVGPSIYCVDDTKPDGSKPCLMGFILANQARDLVSLTPDARKEVLTKHYAKMFQDDRFLRPVYYIEKNWMEEEYSGGCYVSALPPGVLTQYGHVLREPHGLVHFAGTESATCWMGYMDGAIQSGERAAREVLHRLGRLPAQDINQDEPPVDYFPDTPVQELSIERHLPSVPQFLLGCAAVGVVFIAWLLYVLQISLKVSFN